MGRYTKLILLLSILLLFLGSIVLFKSDKNKISIKVNENEVVINNFEMAKVVDEKNNFYKINAETAVLNRQKRIAELTDFTLVYKKGETDLRASSQHGVIHEEVRVDVSGKIIGTVNEMSFETGSDGEFNYDFDTEIGVIKGNVVVNSAEVTILSDTAHIYHKANSMEFDGNVKVIYKN